MADVGRGERTVTSPVRLAWLIVMLLSAVTCGRGAPPSADRATTLRAVPMPDASKMSAQVQSQLRDRFAALETAERTIDERRGRPSRLRLGSGEARRSAEG